MASYYATAALGVFISEQKIKDIEEEYGTKMVRGCEHGFDNTMNFCPECGKERIIQQEIAFCLEDWITGIIGKDFVTHFSTDQVSMIVAPKDFCVRIGDINYSAIDSFDIPTDEEVLRVRTQLSKLLKPHGLWDEKLFKFWNIGYCSY